jgi:hypothetical protein
MGGGPGVGCPGGPPYPDSVSCTFCAVSVAGTMGANCASGSISRRGLPAEFQGFITNLGFMSLGF